MKPTLFCCISSVIATANAALVPKQNLSDYISHPVAALGLAVAMAWVGVVANFMLSGNKANASLVIGRLLAAFIITFVIYAVAEWQSISPILAVAFAGVAGLFFDVTLSIFEKRWIRKINGNECNQQF